MNDITNIYLLYSEPTCWLIDRNKTQDVNFRQNKPKYILKLSCQIDEAFQNVNYFASFNRQPGKQHKKFQKNED